MQLNNRIFGLFGRTTTNTSLPFYKDIKNQKEISSAKGHGEKTNKAPAKKQIAQGGEAPPLFGWALAKIRPPKADKTADLSPHKQNVQGEAAPLFGWMSLGSSSKHAVDTASSLLPPPVPPRISSLLPRSAPSRINQHLAHQEHATDTSSSLLPPPVPPRISSLSPPPVPPRINQHLAHQEQDVRPAIPSRSKLPEQNTSELRLPPVPPPKPGHSAKNASSTASLTQEHNGRSPATMASAHTQALQKFAPRSGQPATSDANPAEKLASRPIPKPRTMVPNKSQTLSTSHSGSPQKIQRPLVPPPIAPKPSSISNGGPTHFVKPNPVSHENYPHSSSLPQMRDNVKQEPPPVLARSMTTNHLASKASQEEPIYAVPRKSFPWQPLR